MLTISELLQSSVDSLRRTEQIDLKIDRASGVDYELNLRIERSPNLTYSILPNSASLLSICNYSIAFSLAGDRYYSIDKFFIFVNIKK
ncbi:MAG TPA: hypothetical protein DEV81_21370 [Cyanobacteria bacterium UBA11049]|nr:hypothetical protein [Cyanobacteria bacterium UBA11049]